VVVEGNGIQVGIIGAIGDCYSSIAVDKCQEVYFKTGKELTDLVKEEADRLRSEGVDFIVYTLHDGYGSSTSSTVTSVDGKNIRSYYDVSLSDGYVDLVFEGHTHQGYLLLDEHGVYHLQNRGDNKGGISHVRVMINSVSGSSEVCKAELISTAKYQKLDDDPIVQELLDKYRDQISEAGRVVGYNGAYRNRDEMRQFAADMYYQAGVEAWGDKYDIVLGGGFMSIRAPGYLSAGEVTYGDLQALFPFDNDLVLCSVRGSDLLNKFINTSNDNYFVCCADYGTIDRNGIYYIVVDTYSAYYAPNRLTVVEEYEKGVYARDLLADFIEAGGLA
jgi:2',3'-cyclic-nucleotide 2'-phosphodiesterase (5'-nucleotidase family)